MSLTTRFFRSGAVPWDAAVVAGIVVAGVVEVDGEDDPLEDMVLRHAVSASVAPARSSAVRIRGAAVTDMAQPHQLRMPVPMIFLGRTAYADQGVHHHRLLDRQPSASSSAAPPHRRRTMTRPVAAG